MTKLPSPVHTPGLPIENIFGNLSRGEVLIVTLPTCTSPQLTDGYRMTDPNRLPEAVFQHLSPPLNNDSATIVYDATYDTMTLEIRLAFVEDRWQVIAALGTQPQVGDVSPPGSTPSPTPPFIPPDLAPAPAGT